MARAAAVRKATKILRSERAKEKVNRAINTRNGPDSYNVLALPLESEIMVWREKGGWKGLYKLKGINGHDVIIKTENGPIAFRYTQAKPYFRTKDAQETSNKEVLTDPDEPEPAIVETPVVRRRGRPRREIVREVT